MSDPLRQPRVAPLRNRRAWAPSSGFAYAVALATVLLTAAIKWLLVNWIQADAPFLLFLAAIMVSAAVGGLGPGLLATALAVVLSNLYMDPVGHFDVSGRSTMLRMALFATEGVVVSVLCAKLRAARDSVERSALEARELERLLLELSEAERRRIGNDLHDGLGQQLTGVAFLAKALGERLHGAGLKPCANDADRIEVLVNQAIAQTRDLASGLAPVDLRSDGLVGALRELALRTERLFKIRCDVHCDQSEPDVGSEETVHLYRIAQEAITNAARHGKAKHVIVKVTSDDENISIVVRDDGVGIQVGQLDAGKGLGLKIMRHRAGRLGGSLHICRAAQIGGTVLTCTCPIAFSKPSNGKPHDGDL